MSPRVLILLWLVIAVVIWNVVFDLHISLGIRDFLRLSAEARLGDVPEPSMRDMMAWSRRQGAFAATQWAIVVFGAGWVSAYVGRKTGSKSEVRSQK